MGIGARVGVVLAALVVVATLAPAPPAFACSCAQMTLDHLAEHQPEAADDVAVVLGGSFGQADLVALDAQLRVTAVGDTSVEHVARLHACGDGVLTYGYDDTGQLVISRRALPTLEATGGYVPAFDPQRATLEVRDVVCREDGAVDALLLAWPDEPDMQLHRDVFGEASVSSVPATRTAVFAGETALFLQEAPNGEGPLRLFAFDPATGQRRLVIEHAGRGGEFAVSPDHDHVSLRTHGDGPLSLIVEVASGHVIGRQRGSWQPVHTPWLADDRLLQRDEDRGGIGRGDPPAYRIVDLQMTEQAPLPVASLGALAAGHGSVVTTSSHGVTVHDTDGELARTRALPWAAGAHSGVVLRPIATDADAQPIHPAVASSPMMPTSDAGTSAAPTSSSDAGAATRRRSLAAIAILLAAGSALVVVRRRAARR